MSTEGAKYISAAYWPKLQKIWIGIVFKDTVNNNIGPKGAKYLSKADWKALEELNIGKEYFIKGIIILEMKDRYAWARHNGKI